MIVKMGGPCFPCCIVCCLPSYSIVEGILLCVHYTITGENVNILNPYITEGRGLLAFNGFRANESLLASLTNQLYFSLAGAYTDSGSGKRICWEYGGCISIHCEGPDIVFTRSIPTFLDENYRPTEVEFGVPGSEDCFLVELNTWGIFCSVVPFGSGPDPFDPRRPLTPDPAFSQRIGSSINCNEPLDSATFDFTIPGNVALGIPDRSLTATLDFQLVTSDSECVPIPIPPDIEYCCFRLGGGGVPGGTGGTGPIDGVMGPCCADYRIPRLLSLAITSVGVPGTACNGCLDLIGAMSYHIGLDAWVANFITCGQYLTLYFYCVPLPSPETGTFGIALYCGGLAIGTPSSGVGSCQPMDLTFGVNIPFGAPCCLSGGNILIRIFEFET